MKNVANLVREEDGQGLVEYAFILLGVALAAIVAVFGFGEVVYSSLQDSKTKLLP